MNTSHKLLSRLLLSIPAFFGATVEAQCQLDWQPGAALAGPSGRVTVMENLPNGDLVVGGWFLGAGAVVANRLARWDGSAWSAFGSGLDDNVYDIVVAPNGDIIVAGKFENAGGAPASHVARWDGSSWSPLGSGLDGIVNCLELLPNGNLLAAGVFTASGTTSTPLVAEWDGSSWSAVGTGLGVGEIASMAQMGNGDLIVAGTIWSASGPLLGAAARWDGASWSALPFQPASVFDVIASPNGDVILNGLLDTTNFATLGRWDGTTLTPLAFSQTFGSIGGVVDLYYDTNGDLLTLHTGSPSNLNPVMRWSGSTWAQIGGEPGVIGVDLHRVSSGDLIVAGGYNVPLTPYPSMSSFDGSSWNPWGDRPLLMSAFASSENGDLYGGSFDGAFSTSAINRWNGSQWVAVGPDVLGTASDVVPLRGGGVLACGYFENGPTLGDTVLWNGASWTVIGDGFGDAPIAGAEGPDGTLYVCGGNLLGQSILAFDGADWVPVGSGLQSLIYDIAFFPNGDLLVPQIFGFGSTATTQCMRWDGLAWTAFGPLLNGRVQSVLVHPDGTVRVAGQQLLAAAGSHVASGDGSTWTALGAGFDMNVTGMQWMPNGDLLVNGAFATAGSVAAGGIARWDGASWSSIGVGANAGIRAAGITRDGDLFVSGSFAQVGGQPSASFGRGITSCPASAQSFGSGCIGPSGPLLLAPTTSAWSGSDYRTRLYGTPDSSVVVHVVGGSQVSVALPPLLPQSFSGCSLFVSPDILDLTVPGPGDAELTLQIARDPVLIGATFYQQAVALQLGANASLVSASSSNGLAVTIGFF